MNNCMHNHNIAYMYYYRWLDPPTEVNAYYSPQFNQFGKNISKQIAKQVDFHLVVILAGILRPPFYAANWFP